MENFVKSLKTHHAFLLLSDNARLENVAVKSLHLMAKGDDLSGLCSLLADDSCTVRVAALEVLSYWQSRQCRYHAWRDRKGWSWTRCLVNSDLLETCLHDGDERVAAAASDLLESRRLNQRDRRHGYRVNRKR